MGFNYAYPDGLRDGDIILVCREKISDEDERALEYYRVNFPGHQVLLMANHHTDRIQVWRGSRARKENVNRTP